MAFSEEVGIDLGTANVLVYIKGKGIVLREPSVVAVDDESNEILAVGEEARQMLGRTPANIIAVRPLKDGVISSFDITERMLKYFIKKTCGAGKFFRPRIMVCVPSGVTEVEKRAVREAATQAGGKEVFLMEEPMAAAIGAGLDVARPEGIMVMLSNGPGDPAENVKVIGNIKEIYDNSDIPILGICLGHQLMALANGGRTAKLKYGHRGANQPVVDKNLDRVFVTTQNHGV